MSARFAAESTPVPGLWLLYRHPSSDERGLFERLFCAKELRRWGHPGVVAQANRSLTRHRGAVRGLHFQHPPVAEYKLVSCLRGRVFDVVVDLRPGPGLLRWHSVELSCDTACSLLIPPGCAHGFQALVDDCELLYFHSAPYVPEAEGAVRTDDPRVGIAWPLPPRDLSARDAGHPLLPTDFAGIRP